MGPFTWFLFVYVLGGFTFIPLTLALILLHAHYTFPVKGDSENLPTDDPANLKNADDEKEILKTATDTLAEQFHRKHESDVAAGYFAVCREYVPGGVNGKPPDKLSPAGEVVATESPSVYQSMYRSIFDRQQKPTIESNKDVSGKQIKKANNVFFVVLRHGHLMLYDDAQQIDVRYVISLEYHDVDIYSGGGEIPEGELWIKRNAIRLSRKVAHTGDKRSLPFFIFGENMSEKEDFYFAMLKNQESNFDDSPPEAQTFNVPDIVKLVQTLHSSEEHLQTRWLNAIMGRMFLAMYKTPELEGFLRNKLTKKISRVKKPNFITKLALQRIDPGESGPMITNPRLKDLTVNGDCMIEADIAYTGNFRVEIAATARIDLGSRFKAREIELVLAVTAKKLTGHCLLRFKPPPSNRLWYTFEKMPTLDLTIEPVVSSRQITYTIILKAIESRIREVLAETIVLPFWDDSPFLDTTREDFRGGIWKKAPVVTKTTEIEEQDPEDEAEAGGSGVSTPVELRLGQDERVMSMPQLPLADGLRPRIPRKTVPPLQELSQNGNSSSFEKAPVSPRILRSSSFATGANPMVSVSVADVDGKRWDTESNQKREDASAILKDLSSRSITASPIESPTGSPPKEILIATSAKLASSRESEASKDNLGEGHSRQQSAASSLLQSPSSASFLSTPTLDSVDSETASLNEGQKQSKSFMAGTRSMNAADRQKTIASIAAATTAAQKWSWGVLQNKKAKKEAHGDSALDVPMGRGRPLPPPGIPLPPPERQNTISNPFSMPKRKAVPPPLLPKRPDVNGDAEDSVSKTPPKPALPERRKRQSSMQIIEGQTDDLLVVEAPADSAPTSPGLSEHHDGFFGHGEESSTVPIHQEEELNAPAPAEVVDTSPSVPVLAEVVKQPASVLVDAESGDRE